MTYPSSTIVKIVMLYGTDQYVCSGTLIRGNWVLTAGHCLNTNGVWATAVYVAPSYYSQQIPFGNAKNQNLFTPSNWSVNQSRPSDIGLIQLDRPIGALAGWIGYGSLSNSTLTSTNSVFHNLSYPADTPYDGEQMYWKSGYFDDATTSPDIVYNNNGGYGGQSGSSIYYKDANDTRYVTAILTHGDNNKTLTGNTRINQDKINFISSTIQSNTPPTPDLIPVGTSYTGADIPLGGTLNNATFVVYNDGLTNYQNTMQVKVYLSTDPVINPTTDIYLGLATYNTQNIAPYGVQILSLIGVPIPNTIPIGNYFLGIIF